MYLKKDPAFHEKACVCQGHPGGHKTSISLLTLCHASIRTLFEPTTLCGSVHDEVRPLGRCCNLLIGLPVRRTKAGAAVTGPEAIGRATELATGGPPYQAIVPPFGCEASVLFVFF